MPAIVVAAIVTAAATTGATVYAAKKNQQAVDAQVKSQSEATAAGSKGNEEALAFQKAQADRDAANQETNRRADYDQWAARESRLGTLGQSLGLPARQIPGYVPQQAPSGSIAGSQPTSQPQTGQPVGPAGQAPSAPPPNATPEQIGQFVESYFASRGTKPLPASVNYFVQKWPELVARGQELGDPNYAMKRLSQAEEFGGGAGGGTSASASTPGSILGTLQANTGAPGYATPAYQAPVIRPGTIRSFA